MILAMVMRIVSPKVMTSTPRFNTSGVSNQNYCPKFIQDSRLMLLVDSPRKPPSTIPASSSKSRIQKFLFLIVCSLPVALHLFAYDHIFITQAVIGTVIKTILHKARHLILIQVHFAHIALVILIILVIQTAFTASLLLFLFHGYIPFR